VLDECAARATAVVRRLDEERFDRVVRETQKRDWCARGLEDPPVDRLGRQFVGDEWPQVGDVALREQMMRGANRSPPQIDERFALGGLRAPRAHAPARELDNAYRMTTRRVGSSPRRTSSRTTETSAGESASLGMTSNPIVS